MGRTLIGQFFADFMADAVRRAQGGRGLGSHVLERLAPLIPGRIAEEIGVKSACGYER